MSAPPSAQGASPESPASSASLESPASHDLSQASVEPAARPSITRDEVAHLARLSRLQLADGELDAYVRQLDVILGAVARVSEVAAADVAPTSHPLLLTNVVRLDLVRPSLTQLDALSGAPAAEDGRFRVPRILGEQA